MERRPFMDTLEKEIFDELFFEGGDDDFMPEVDEEGKGDEAVDEMLSVINNGDTGDEDDLGADNDDLAELEKEFQLASVAGETTSDDASTTDTDIDNILSECGSECSSESEDGDEEEALPVDPQTDKVGDMLLAQSITPDLVENTLDAAEYEEFIESGDAHVAASEGLISEGYVTEAMEEAFGQNDVFEESAKFAPEGKKWKMTKSARLSQLFETSLQIEARLHKDPDYARMQKIYAARRKIRLKWRQKYGSLAMRRAKKYLKGLMRSNSGAMQKLAQRLTGGKK